jgi:predicted nucleotidyltransferase
MSSWQCERGLRRGVPAPQSGLLERALAVLRERSNELRAEGFLHIAVFGSVARRHDGLQSDIDLVVEVAPGVDSVGAWSIDDLVAALRIAADPDELRAVFAPGYAEDRLPALVWERTHGRAKRVAVTAQLLREVVWRRQVAVLGHRDDAPVIDEDAAMLMVDAARSS